MNSLALELAHNDRETCNTLFAEQTNQIIYRSFVADTQTAVAAMLKLAEGQTHHCLLESVEGGGKLVAVHRGHSRITYGFLPR